jgi:plastocyanin
MTRRRTTPLLLCALALTVLGACGGGGGSSAKCPAKVDTKTVAAGEITVCASDIKYDVGTIKATAGPVKITLVNDGDIFHTLRIPDADGFELKANGGKTVSGTVTLKKGSYAFDCTVSGHAAAGMKGKIEVG